jgi:two-component system, NarL family, nitrate/nitrite response regulator NarP
VDWSIPQLGAERLLGILRDRPAGAAHHRLCLGRRSGRAAPRAGRRCGCLLHQGCAEQQLLDVALSVATGAWYFPIWMCATLKRDPRESLTEREKTMLSALAKGRTNTELAAELGISINTVKFHLRNLYEKLDLRNRSQAIAFFYANEP